MLHSTHSSAKRFSSVRRCFAISLIKAWTCRILDLWLRLSNRAHIRTYSVKEFDQLLKNQGLIQVTVEKYQINWFWGMMTAQGIKTDLFLSHQSF